MAPSTRVCVLVPSLNNASTIAAVVTDSVAQGLPVIVIDDGSTDGTGETARTAGANVVTHEVNRGKGQALQTGWQTAVDRGFTHAIAIDADGQHHPSDIPAFLARLEQAPDALLVGDRPMDGDHVPRSSRIGRAISDFMLWAAASKEIGRERPDTQCGFRVYPLAHVPKLPLRGVRYEFEMEVLVRAAWLGIPVLGVPISVHYPPHDERVSHFHKWRDNGRIVGVYTRLMLMRLFWPVFRPRALLVESSPRH
ncbi:MAG: glycosyltransferase family 2 protein [Proteobacteria bacterium]|nr:glycosyltransferase family 2 protein [Pseudomonadota bacterium]